MGVVEDWAPRVAVVENEGATVVAAGQPERAVERVSVEDEEATKVGAARGAVDVAGCAAQTVVAVVSLLGCCDAKMRVAGAVARQIPVAEVAAQGAVVVAGFAAQTVVAVVS